MYQQINKLLNFRGTAHTNFTVVKSPLCLALTKNIGYLSTQDGAARLFGIICFQIRQTHAYLLIPFLYFYLFRRSDLKHENRAWIVVTLPSIADSLCHSKHGDETNPTCGRLYNF